MAKLELLASGLGFLEGPRYEPSSGGLYFSDVHGGGVHRLNPDGSFTVAIPKRRGVGGVALHARGGVVAGGRTICHVVDGNTRILYGADDIPGFNDLFVDSKGRVITGTMRDDPFGDKEANQRTTGECIRITAEGQAEVLYTDVALTNGIG